MSDDFVDAVRGRQAVKSRTRKDREIARLTRERDELREALLGLQSDATSAEKTTNSPEGTLKQLIIAVKARCANALNTEKETG